MSARTYKTRLLRDGRMTAIPVPFDPKAAFGTARAPVKVTVNGYTYRSTISIMRGETFVPLRASHRAAAGLEGAETVSVRLELDTDKREVTAPQDFVAALQTAPEAWARWQALSFTHQREHVEAIETAKKADTRARRIARAVEDLRKNRRG